MKTTSVLGMQSRIGAWLITRFGMRVFTDREERAARVLEEALELAQAEGVDAEAARRIHARVYSRPRGLAVQEAAGVAVTALAWAAAVGVDLAAAVEAEVTRIEALPIDRLREKHMAKVDAGIAIPCCTNPNHLDGDHSLSTCIGGHPLPYRPEPSAAEVTDASDFETEEEGARG